MRMRKGLRTGVRGVCLLAAALLACGGDTDGDGVADASDNCTLVANGPLLGPHDQLDADGDGFGNVCDGDLNQDEFVGGPDFDLFLQCFNREVGESVGPADDPNCEESDMNGDGFVGGPDFDRFLAGFNAAPGPAAPPTADPMTTVDFSAACNCQTDAFGEIGTITGSLTLDGDATGGGIFGQDALVAFEITIGDVVFDETNASESRFSTIANTLSIDAAGEVGTIGFEFALDAAGATGDPYWIQFNPFIVGGIIQFSSYDEDDPANDGTFLSFPFDGIAAPLVLDVTLP